MADPAPRRRRGPPPGANSRGGPPAAREQVAGAKRRPARPRRPGAEGGDRQPDEQRVPKAWGALARRGAGKVTGRRTGLPPPVRTGRGPASPSRLVPAERAPSGAEETWRRVDAPADLAPPAPARRRDPSARVPRAVQEELAGALAGPMATKMRERLAAALRAYERDRYGDARRLLKPLTTAAPHAPAVRELHGLVLYRLGRWADAIRELEAFVGLTGSYDQHPVIADCYRAQKRWDRVEALWADLRRASPSSEVVAEGRIVAAGALADRGELQAALRLLEAALRRRARPRLHDLRSWYAAADLYERAGDVPRARELFRSVVSHDPDFVDAADRLASLA